MAGKIAKTEKKALRGGIVKKFGKTETDTGSPEVQVALITNRINQLNGHMKNFPKDNSTMRGLMGLVGKRRRLLAYLKNLSDKRYSDVIKALEIRK